MTIDATIWHYPRCSKSRKSLKILKQQDVDITIRRYFDDPPDPETLAETIELLGIKPKELVRTKESLYDELNVNEKSMTDRQWIELMVENPRLIERPVVITENGAVIGRPPARVYDVVL